jgi:hypothetical protein
MTEYKSNSHASKKAELANVEPAGEKKIEKVVTGTVKTRDNKGRKFADIFISEDAANVKSYIVMDVLVPAIKKAVSDIVTDGISMILYGGTGGGNRSRGSSGNKVSYTRYYDDRRDDRRDDRYASRSRFEYDDIVFETRGEAESVRRQMLDVIDRYGFVTVADMYDMAGITPPYTSNNYGWVSIRSSEAVRVRDGYVLRLPKASPID